MKHDGGQVTFCSKGNLPAVVLHIVPGHHRQDVAVVLGMAWATATAAG